MSRSSQALYSLRGFLIVLVVAFHSFLAYLQSQPAVNPVFDDPPFHWKAVPIVDHERWLGFDLFCASQYVYLMQLMFLLSGLFVWPSLQRKGAWRYLQDRVFRLGVPFLFGVCLLMPLTHYAVYRITAADPSWSAFWRHWLALPFWPAGQLWFLWCLLTLDCVAVALYRIAPGALRELGRLSATAAGKPALCFMFLIGASALVYVPVALLFKVWDWVQFGPFALQPTFALLYCVYFFTGVGIGMNGIDCGLLAQDGPLRRRWPLWVAGAFAGFLVWLIPTGL